MPNKYYIAYGSNLNVSQMKHRCPNAKILGTAMLEGWQLLFKGSKTGSYLTIEEKEGGRVPVAIWEITPEDEKALDRYEGYPHFYYKRELKVKYEGYFSGRHRTRTAMVYIMHEDRPLGLPSYSYLSICEVGYHFFRFDVNYLNGAIYRSKGGSENESEK